MTGELWTNLWWLSRVVVGGLIHIALVIFAIFNIEIIYEVVKYHYVAHSDTRIFSPSMVGVIASISFFTASMAGAYWIKSMYIKNFLPELMDEISKKLMKG